MKTRKSLEKAARASIQKASEAVRLANEALAEANAAMKMIEDFSDEELAQVAGGNNFVHWEPKSN